MCAGHCARRCLMRRRSRMSPLVMASGNSVVYCSRAWRGSGFCASRARRGEISPRRTRWFLSTARRSRGVRRVPRSSMISSREPTGSRYSLTAPRPTISTPCSSHRAQRPICKSNQCPIGKWDRPAAGQLYRCHDVAARGPDIHADDKGSRSALI